MLYHEDEVVIGNEARHARVKRECAHAQPVKRSAARLILLEEQLEVLEQALDALVADVRAGRRSFLPYRQLKRYGR